MLAELRAQLDHYADGSHPQVEGDEPAQDRPVRARSARSTRARSTQDRSKRDQPPDDADAESVAHAIVLRQLSAQAKTRTELERVLKRKNVPQQAAESVLDRMQEVGLVDDATFADAWVESRQQRRHLSATALRHELRGKGVASDLVDQAVSGVDAEDEYTAALSLAERKYERMRALDTEVVRRRLSGVLARRGFGSGVIFRVLGEVLPRR